MLAAFSFSARISSMIAAKPGSRRMYQTGCASTSATDHPYRSAKNP